MGRGQNSTKLTGCTSGCSFHCIAMHCLGVLCRLKGAGGTTAEQCCTTLTGCTLYTVHRYVVHMTLRILGWVVSIWIILDKRGWVVVSIGRILHTRGSWQWWAFKADKHQVQSCQPARWCWLMIWGGKLGWTWKTWMYLENLGVQGKPDALSVASLIDDSDWCS